MGSLSYYSKNFFTG